jgi:uncharacterized glyoxalase superfamily protein PhnB
MEMKAIPILRFNDLSKAKEFYLDFIGCRFDWEHRFAAEQPTYMQVSTNEMVLHLSDNPRFSSAVIYIETVELEVFHNELLLKKMAYGIPGIAPTPWGTRQVELEDPFGNILRFNEIEAQS